MLSVTVLATGKLKETFYLSAAQEYAKRLQGSCDFKLIELPEVRLPDEPSPAQIQAALDKEAAAVCEKLPKGCWLCALAIEGKKLSSEAFSQTLEQAKLAGHSKLCFLLGSSYGLSSSLKSHADMLLSISDMTFPHHLARILLLEQLYRAQAIAAGSKYHK